MDACALCGATATMQVAKLIERECTTGKDGEMWARYEIVQVDPLCGAHAEPEGTTPENQSLPRHLSVVAGATGTPET